VREPLLQLAQELEWRGSWRRGHQPDRSGVV